MEIKKVRYKDLPKEQKANFRRQWKNRQAWQDNALADTKSKLVVRLFGLLILFALLFIFLNSFDK